MGYKKMRISLDISAYLHWKKWKTRHTSFSATKCLDDLFLVFRRRSSVYSVLVFRDGKSGV